MKRVFLALWLVLAVVPLRPAFAQAGGERLRGTIVKAEATRLEVKTRQGKTVSIALTPATKLLRKKAPATAAELTVGRRVTVEAVRKGDALEATEIKIGADPDEKAQPAPAPSPAPSASTSPRP